jgi:hypothetical protein
MRGPAVRIGLGWLSQSSVTGGSFNRTPTVSLISWFTAPYCGSNMFRQTVATMIWGMTTGMM